MAESGRLDGGDIVGVEPEGDEAGPKHSRSQGPNQVVL